MKKLFKLYFHYQRIGAQALLAFRLSAILQFLNLFIWVIVDLIFFKSIFSNTGNFAGWNYWDAVLLILTLSLFWDLFWKATSGGIVYIPDKIQNGDIATFLLKPVNSLIHLIFSELGILSNSINTPALLIYYLWNNQINFTSAQIVIYFSMLFLGVGIFTWILLIIVSFAFWSTNIDMLTNVYWELQNIARYPKDIFAGFLSNLFMFIVPVFFIANLPSEVLRYGINIQHLILGIVLNLILGIIALKTWHLGLKAYTGTSS